MKNKMKYLGTIGVFVGMAVSKVLGNYFGLNGKIVVAFTTLVIVSFALVYLVIKKYYLASLIMFIMILPLIMCVIGMYLNNEYLAGGGIALFIIILPLLIKLIKNIERSEK